MTKKTPDSKSKDEWNKDSKKGPAAKKDAPQPKPTRAGLSTATDSDPNEIDAKSKPAENSIGVRIVAFGVALVFIGMSIVFVPTQPVMALAYLVALVTGNYMSFLNRHAKTAWQSRVVLGGIALVGVNCWLELQSGIASGELSAFAPGIHFVAGTYVMQSFELRTRSEINTSMMLGLIILALFAPLSKSIIFGGGIFIYLCLLAALLYFDCVQNTAQNSHKEQISEISLIPVATKRNVFFKGNAVMCLSVIPIISTALFLFLPRADGFIDSLYTTVAGLNTNKTGAPIMMPETLPESAKRWRPPPRSKPGKPPLIGKPGIPGNPGSAGSEKDAQKGGPEKNDASKSAEDKKTKGKSKFANGKNGKEKGGKKGTGADAKGESGDSIGYDDEMDVSQSAATSNEIVLKVRSYRTCYMRMYAFDHYDESGKWTSTITDARELERPARNGIDLSQQPALSISANFPAVQLHQECVVERDLSRDIPVAWIPNNVDIKTKSILVDESGSLRLTNDEELKKGTKYKVTSSFPVYDLPKMRSAPILEQADQDDIRFKLSRYLQMPKECPDELIAQADNLTAGNFNWFVQTEKITEFLRHSYKYSYNKHHEDNSDPLNTFFSDEKVGDCKDFATALVLMNRAVGIPARIVCGFSPGELNSMTGYHEVKLKNLHSWAEVYIPGYGWVPFDATPAGYLPDKPKEKSYDLDSLQNQKNSELEQLARPKQDEQNEKKPGITWQQIVGAISAALVVGACLVFLIRAIIKAIKKARENAPGYHPAKKILKKVETALKRWKVVRLPQETGPEFGRKVKAAARERTRLGQAIDKDFNSNIESFMDKFEAAYYGNKELLTELEMLSKPIVETIMKSGKVGTDSGAGAASAAAAGSELKTSSKTEAGNRPTKPGNSGR
jgi:transglutaminase-like putative cysteine protease